jgi:dienelactone hydrolase
MRVYRRTLVFGAVIASSLLWAAPAGATVAPTLHADAACDTKTPHAGFSYVFCDDGVPNAGGLVANGTGAAAVTVPAKYGGDGYSGLPAGAGAPTDPGADAGGSIALDVDISWPTTAAPAGGYPLIVMMHGCCGGNKTGWEAASFEPVVPGTPVAPDGTTDERWHYNNAWFASRGYAVINYTARGFVNRENRGSTGQTQLDSRRFEINDYQHLACQLLGAASDFSDVTPNPVTIDPERVVVTGGSYGGGFSWMAATDPKWDCDSVPGVPASTDMQLAAAAPKYGWTDLAYTLVPTGTHSQSPGQLPATNGCDTGPKTLSGADCPVPATPVGMPKMSIVGGLYATGNAQGIDHTTFPQSIHEAFACLNGPYPLETSPACANVLDNTLPEFLRDRSAYYQNEFFTNIAGNASYRVPIFNAATFTDPLFPEYENRRMVNRLRQVVPGYPIQSYYGDYQHFVQNKDKEWGDICGADRHVCSFGDYPGGDVNVNPAALQRTGVTTRLNRFIDFYAEPDGGYSGPAPTFNATASLQVCQNHPLGQTPDEPGPTFSAATFEALTSGTLSADLAGDQTTLSNVEPNSHAVGADPVFNDRTNSRQCVDETQLAEPGVASYTSEPLPSRATMIGSATATIDFTLTGPAAGFQLNARLYDVFPDGTAVMVDRGPRRVTSAEAATGRISYQLHGTGWRFPAGHRVRIEVAQDDEPFVAASDVPSSANLTRVQLSAPIRESDIRVGGGSDVRSGRCANLRLGGPAKDMLIGTEGGDEIRGGDGKDVVKGLGGADCLDGERGKDKVKGGSGEDEIIGAKGRDRLKGGKAPDEIKGGKGKDRVKAKGGGRDDVRCGKGRDRVKADRKDRLRGCEKVRRGGRR